MVSSVRVMFMVLVGLAVRWLDVGKKWHTIEGFNPRWMRRESDA